MFLFCSCHNSAMKNYIRACILVFSLSQGFLVAQSHLRAGVDLVEYADLIAVLSNQVDTAISKEFLPVPKEYRLNYRSEVMGLDNRWELWMRQDSVAILSIRGTTANSVSWLQNFYAAMAPARGKLKIADDFQFDYSLASHPDAGVHIGWLIGTAFLARDILPKVDSCYHAGIREFIIAGHSQGGAIAYLLTAYLYQLKQEGRLPDEMVYKTYCSAAPKPGNLQFAYEYERLTQGGWSVNVVNAADWVPETPLSIQTLTDFNAVNPFTDARSIIKKQPFPKSFVLNYVYGQMDRPTRRSQKRLQKYLGRKAAKYVQLTLPEYEPPHYMGSNNYVRTGDHYILYPDQDYFLTYPEVAEDKFVHHMFKPYFYLATELLNKEHPKL